MDIGTGAGAGPVFRTAQLDDLEDIAALEREQFDDQSLSYVALRQLFELHGTNWVVAELDGAVRGYALVGVDTGRRGWVMGLAVATNYHGRKLGRALLELAVARCRAAPVDSVYLTVRPSDEIASRLYKSVGFELAEHDEQYFGPGQPRDVLRYRIRRAPTGPPLSSADPRWLKPGQGR
ncbi:ribosomal-protein-alanine N-acetyltransferase [Nocardia amikacinitolerans]|uniref:GNAT family N-acetyltransferase n=1 Tax=Nocardia amikacinitolerans TaxID=756689 RepID=UPI000AF7C35C|nr:N-acetyltransferase [Nocardia amikacinitolerans]MCP2320562.1 ribosomal-protein-alanine N-acetyltransferase [Nocardia amikacinitolerans]